MLVNFPMLYTAIEGGERGDKHRVWLYSPLRQQRYQTYVSRLGFSIDLLENPIFFTRLSPRP